MILLNLHNLETMAITNPTSMNIGATRKIIKPNLSKSDVLVVVGKQIMVVGKQITVQILEKTASQMAFSLPDKP
jgi:hypothetical protein